LVSDSARILDFSLARFIFFRFRTNNDVTRPSSVGIAGNKISKATDEASVDLSYAPARETDSESIDTCLIGNVIRYLSAQVIQEGVRAGTPTTIWLLTYPIRMNTSP